MNTLFYLKLYAVTVPVFFAIDLIWLGFIARNLYRDSLGHLMSPTVNWTAAIVFYLMFIIGILIFSVVPALKREALVWAAVYGGLFGFFTYATYELTNLATMRDWPMKLVFVDTLWGIVLCSAVASVSFTLGKRLL
jgi:uncharacterized membrane protein